MTRPYDPTKLQLLPGRKYQQPKPFFKSREEYEEWSREFTEKLTPELERQRHARAASMIHSLDHFIDT